MRALLSASGIDAFNKNQGVWFGNQPARPAKSKTEADDQPAFNLDALLDSALDDFVKSAPEAEVVSPSSPKLSLQIGRLRTLAALAGQEAELAKEPPQEQIVKDRPRKVAVARELSEWMRAALTDAGAEVAVVARQGGLAHKKQDRTGMLHTGIARPDPQSKQWKIYNLVDEIKAGEPKCSVAWTEPADFFYQQGGHQRDALLLIPDKATQANMARAFSSGLYKNLAFTGDYNLVSAPHSPASLNCNKWSLLNVLGAKKEDYNPKVLLADIGKNYQAGRLNVRFWQRLFASWNPQVRGNEVPWRGPIHTVTVESLFKSDLFEQKKFCAERPAKALT